MKKLFLSTIIISSLLVSSCKPKADLTACEAHLKNCPISEDCPEHPICEAHEKCPKGKDCKKHPNCVAFDNR